MVPKSFVKKEQLAALTFLIPIGPPPAISANHFRRRSVKKSCYAIHEMMVEGEATDRIEDKMKKDKATDKIEVVAIPLFSAEKMGFFTTPALNKELSLDFIEFKENNGKKDKGEGAVNENGKRSRPEDDLDTLAPSNNLAPLVLKPKQLAALETCLERFKLTGSVILCANTGFGKTITACTLATNLSWLPAATIPTFLNLPLSNQKSVGVVIVTHRDFLKRQWGKTLEENFGARSTTCLERFLEECSTSASSAREPILITSPKKLSNQLIALKNETNRNCWINVKLCIVDEVHTMVNETGIAALLRINCDFSLGLSATPYRKDARDVCLTNLYGKSMIKVKMEQTPNAKKEVYVWKTLQDPPKLKFKGKDKVRWNDVINFQCSQRKGVDKLYDAVADIHRNVLGSGKTILFLTKRKKHAKAVANAFMSRNLTVSNLCEETLDKSSRGKTLGKVTGKVATGEAAAKWMKMEEEEEPKVSDIIIATYLKAGEGLDEKSICGLVLASDMDTRFIQVLGRIRCFNNPFNFVIDIVDNSKQLYDHFRKRLTVYKECDYKLQSPHFLTPEALAKHVMKNHGKL